MVNQFEICPICGEGHLNQQVDKNNVEYNGRSCLLDSHYSVCDSCGSEQASPIQTRDNKRAMLAFKKEVDGLLTGADIRALRTRLGINQNKAAAIFGGGPVAFSKYENDDVVQSDPMDKLLRVADEFPAVFSALAKKAEVQLSNPIYAQINSAQYVSSVELVKLENENPAAKRPQLRLVSSFKPPLQASSKEWVSQSSLINVSRRMQTCKKPLIHYVFMMFILEIRFHNVLMVLNQNMIKTLIS